MRWRETPDLSQVTDGCGESWEIMATSYKPYPCGFVIHPVLDCVLDWRPTIQRPMSRASWCAAIRCWASGPTGRIFRPGASRR